MTKKSLNKLLSVVLALAICFTAVYGCLITANAAVEVCCAQWSEGSTSKDFDESTIYLALQETSPLQNGIWGAEFQIDCGTDLVLKDAKVVAEAGEFTSVKKDGTFSEKDIDVACSGETSWVTVDCDGYSTIVLELTFGFKTENGLAKMGEIYDVSIVNDTLWMIDNDEDNVGHHHTAGAITGSIKASCDHVIAVKGSPVNTDKINGYTVYAESYCTICKKDFGYQLVPSSESLTDVVLYWEKADDSDLIDAEDGEQLGTKASPIIINSVEELHYLATAAGREATFDKYYKMADDIDAIVLQSKKAATNSEGVSLLSLTDAADVEAYFKSGTFKKWSEHASTDVSTAFAGHFDGNGVTVYGLYENDANPSGLFPIVHTNTVDPDEVAKLEKYAKNYTTYTKDNPAESAIAAADKFVRFTSAERVTISNLNVTNSSITASVRAGFVIGYGATSNDYLADYWVDIKNVSVYNNYMASTTKSNQSANGNGLLAGTASGGSLTRYYGSEPNVKSESAWVAHCGITFDNCLVYGNKTLAVNKNSKPYDYGIGAMGNTAMGMADIYTNSIILGTTPYLSAAIVEGIPENTYSSHRSLPNEFKNVYTDAPTEVCYAQSSGKHYYYNYVTGYAGSATTIEAAISGATANSSYKNRLVPITADSAKGYDAVTNCPALDWGNDWNYGVDGEYPSLIQGTPNIIYWDGTTGTHPTEQDENGTYIINTAEELHYIAQGDLTVADTAGKSYKISDDIDAIILQPYATVDKAGGVEKLMNLSSADETYDYFKNSTGVTFTPWVVNNLETPFNGNFDGNGVKIYGLYADGTKLNAGLFRAVDSGVPSSLDANGYSVEGATFENFAIKNSYLETMRRMGAVAAMSREANYNKNGTANGLINFENIEVSNCYMYCNSTNTYTTTSSADANNKITYYNVGITENGVLVGSLHATSDVLRVNNTFVYGNTAKFKQWTNYNQTEKKYLVSEQTDTSYRLDDIRLFGATGNKVVLGETEYKLEIKNSIALGAAWNTNYIVQGGYYSNFYTDATNYSADDMSKHNCAHVTADGIIGKQAETNMPNLAWGTVWYANQDGYPTLAAIDKAHAATVSNSKIAILGSNTSYNEDGSLDLNFHFIKSEGYEPVLYIGKSDKSGCTEFEALTNPVKSSLVDQLGDDAMMFTIPNLAARDADTKWVLSLVATNGSTIEWGKSGEISLGEHARDILSGKAQYASDELKAKYEEADKKVAAALLNYSDAATIALGTKNDAVNKTKIEYWNNEVTKPTDTSAGTEDDPIIIKTPAELAYMATAGYEYTTIDGKNKYFKIADNVKAFVLQPKEYGAEIMALEDAADVAEYYSDTTKSFYQWKGVSDTAVEHIFSGYFDGNGVTIYGLYNTQNYKRQGLIGETDGNVTICNVNIKGAYLTNTVGWYGQGAVIGANKNKAGKGVLLLDGKTTKGFDTTVIKNCVVTDCYMRSTDTKNDNRVNNAVLMGRTEGVVMIDGCFVRGNDTLFTNDTLSDEYSLYGYARNSWNQLTTSSYFGGYYDNYYPTLVLESNCVCCLVVNTISIGTEPYHMGYPQNRLDNDDCFINVYTDAPAGKLQLSSSQTENYVDGTIMNINPENFIGESVKDICKRLDWDSDWMTTSGYPQPVQSDYAPSSKTLYWNGGTDTVLDDEKHSYSTQDGTAENPIIIDSVEELAYLAGKSSGPLQTQFYTQETVDGVTKTTFTGPKHFKLADGIDKMVLQSADYAEILEKTSLSETVEFFTKKPGKDWAGICKWHGAGTDNTSSDYAYTKQDSFCGVFDGNGVEIYGMYMNTVGYGALFGDMAGDSAVKNVTIKNAYMNVTGEGNYRAAAFVSNGDNALNKTHCKTTIDNCAVENSYFATVEYEFYNTGSKKMETRKNNVGVVAGSLPYSYLKVNNCKVNNCEVWYDTDAATDTYKDENSVTHEYSNTTPIKGALFGNAYASANMISNSIILGSSPASIHASLSDTHFSNVYTDQTSEWSTVTNIADLNALKGSAAADIVAALNAGNGKTVWYVGAEGDYPSFKEASGMPSWLKAEYDLFSVSAFNNYAAGQIGAGDSVIKLRSSSLNLGANPYVSFVFTFKGDYLTNRDKISITLKTAERDYAVAVPAYSDEKLHAQWINNVGNTNHTYQFTDMTLNEFVNGVEVWASYEGGEAVLLGTVSAEGIATSFVNANKKTPCNYYANVADAAKAVCFYAAKIKERISIS